MWVVLVDFGVILFEGKVVWVWDFIVEIRYLVVFECFVGIDGMNEDEFVVLVMCDVMIGMGLVLELKL